MEEKKEIAVWFRDEITEGGFRNPHLTLYSSFKNALDAHKAFVEEKKGWYTENYGEGKFVVDNHIGYRNIYTTINVKSNYDLHRVESNVKMLEIND